MSLGIAWEGLIKAYDSLVNKGAKICPIAHTYISVHIGVLIDKNGKFLCAKVPDVKGELIAVPCRRIWAQNRWRSSSFTP